MQTHGSESEKVEDFFLSFWHILMSALLSVPEYLRVSARAVGDIPQ